MIHFLINFYGHFRQIFEFNSLWTTYLRFFLLLLHCWLLLAPIVFLSIVWQRRFKQHCGGPDSQSALLKKLDAFFAMMHKNSVLTWKVGRSNKYIWTSWLLPLKKWCGSVFDAHYSYPIHLKYDFLPTHCFTLPPGSMFATVWSLGTNYDPHVVQDI